MNVVLWNIALKYLKACLDFSWFFFIWGFFPLLICAVSSAMALTHTATTSPVVCFLLKSTSDYPLSLRFPVWTLSDLFVKHRHFKQWWCERYFMCFKSLIWSINIFSCQACWPCYSPNTGMLNIWLLYVLVIVSPYLSQALMPKNSNWKYGAVVHLLLSQV